jgi:putative transposase
VAQRQVEDIYLNGYASMEALTLELTQYFAFYNGERRRQSPNNQTPDRVYASGQGGGAMIVDKFGSEKQGSAAPLQTKKSPQLEHNLIPS